MKETDIRNGPIETSKMPNQRALDKYFHLGGNRPVAGASPPSTSLLALCLGSLLAPVHRRSCSWSLNLLPYSEGPMNSSIPSMDVKKSELWTEILWKLEGIHLGTA